MSAPRCPYAVLGVSPTSEQFVIEAAYKAMLKRYHPDINKSGDAAHRTQELVEAYAIIGNPVKRAEYDAARKAAESKAREKRKANTGSNTNSSKSPPPPPPPRQTYTARPPVQPDQEGNSGLWRVGLTLAGIVGFVALVGAIGANAPSVSNLSEQDNYDAAADALEALADQNSLQENNVMTAGVTSLDGVAETPVEFVTVEGSSKRFVRILFAGGLSQARKYSQDCAEKLKIPPVSWDSVDQCVAFDLAAAHLDEEISRQLKAPVNSYFQFQSKNSANLYELAGAKSYLVGSRVTQIRAAAEQTSEEALQDKIAQMQQAEVGKPNGSPVAGSEPNGDQSNESSDMNSTYVAEDGTTRSD